MHPQDWTPPNEALMFEALDATWPPAARKAMQSWTIRDGQGGGSRVSSASGSGDISQAERAMQALGQKRQFMVRATDAQLDHDLEQRGYGIKDPVIVFATDPTTFVTQDVPKLSAIPSEGLLARQSEIWAKGGIGPGRLAVMARVAGPKTYMLARHTGRAAGTGFVACHKDIAMLHALEILPEYRRMGIGRNMTFASARWAAEQAATTFCLMCTRANTSAVALYQSLGMVEVAHYHYRLHPDDV